VWDQFYYGVCYYPEHWHESRHASDIARIAACGFNVVRLGEGAWSYWEPREGEYQFEMFDRVIDLCRQHGIKVIMGTPTYCAPAWVSRNYPEVLRWNFERIPMSHGSRRNFNYTSPKYYELSQRICTALAEHYKDEPQIIAWQLDNEFNCHSDVSYAPSDTLAFRKWLHERYETIDRLNDAWGTRFWSQTYDDWDQVDLPHPTVTWQNPTQLLDETRFISDCVIRFAKSQADILRKANSKWIITHNGLFKNIDGPKLVKTALDTFCHDQYPLFWKDDDWPAFAAGLQQARSLSFPFGIMEQQAGPGGQMGYLLRTPRPGQMRLWAWQSVAHGAKLLSFFRWRTCPYGSEQHWHGLLDPDDRDNRRITEVKQISQELKKLPVAFFDAPPTRCIAVLRDFDNETNERRVNTYNKDGEGEHWRWINEASQRHFAVDFVWPGSDFGGYRLLIAPHLKIVEPTLAEKLTAFVRAGGTLVLTAQSGSKDRNCHLVEMPLPGLLRELTGIEIEDWTTLGERESRDVRLHDGRQLSLGTFVERLKPAYGGIDATQTVGTWLSNDPLLVGAPAITRHRAGRGSVIYVGGYCPSAAVGMLLAHLAASLDLHPIVEADGDIEAIERSVNGAKYLVLLNHAASARRVRRVGEGRDLLTEHRVPSKGVVLQPYDVVVIARNHGR
jgi:beta-galactosidase